MPAEPIRWGTFRDRLARSLRVTGLVFLMAAAVLHPLAMAAAPAPSPGHAGPCGHSAVAAAPASSHHHRPVRRSAGATHPANVAIHGDCGLCTLPVAAASAPDGPARVPPAIPLDVPVGRSITPPSQPPIA